MNKNKVRFYVNKKPRQMFKSIVERNGTRAIDTGVFYFPKSVNIEINDDVAYIQDRMNSLETFLLDLPVIFILPPGDFHLMHPGHYRVRHIGDCRGNHNLHHYPSKSSLFYPLFLSL